MSVVCAAVLVWGVAACLGSVWGVESVVWVDTGVVDSCRSYQIYLVCYASCGRSQQRGDGSVHVYSPLRKRTYTTKSIRARRQLRRAGAYFVRLRIRVLPPPDISLPSASTCPALDSPRASLSGAGNSSVAVESCAATSAGAVSVCLPPLSTSSIRRGPCSEEVKVRNSHFTLFRACVDESAARVVGEGEAAIRSSERAVARRSRGEELTFMPARDECLRCHDLRGREHRARVAGEREST